MTKGIIEAKEVKKGHGLKAVKVATRVLGIGIAAGIALIVLTDKAKKKAESENKED